MGSEAAARPARMETKQIVYFEPSCFKPTFVVRSLYAMDRI